MPRQAVKASDFKNLSLRQIVGAAHRYGLEPRDRLVIQGAQQADRYHGDKVDRPIWGTDSRGIYQADKLLDGYLSEETACIRADARTHAAFCRDAYGC